MKEEIKTIQATENLKRHLSPVEKKIDESKISFSEERVITVEALIDIIKNFKSKDNEDNSELEKNQILTVLAGLELKERIDESIKLKIISMSVNTKDREGCKILAENLGGINCLAFVSRLLPLLKSPDANKKKELIKMAMEIMLNLDESLFIAVELRDEALAKAFLEKGANPNVQYKWGWTSVHLAVEKENKEILEILLEGGANPDVRDSCGKTPLHWAVCYERIEIVKVLIEKRANLDIRAAFGKTALHFAIEKQNEQMVEILLSGKPNLELKDHQELTSLQLAVDLTAVNIVKMLLAEKADPNVSDKEGKKLLKLATEKQNLKIIKELLKAKCQPEIVKDGKIITLSLSDFEQGNMRIIEKLNYLNLEGKSGKGSPSSRKSFSPDPIEHRYRQGSKSPKGRGGR